VAKTRVILATAFVVCLGMPSVGGAATLSEGPAGIVYEGGNGANVVQILAPNGRDLRFEERNEDVVIDNLAAGCSVTAAPAGSSVTCVAPDEVFEVDAGGGGDRVFTAFRRRSCGPIGFDFRVDGGDGQDEITAANDARNVLEGGSSRDYILGCGGRDEIWGGQGADRLDGFIGPDRILGGGGGDRIEGGTGGDELIGGLGRDRLGGDEGADVLRGAEGSDRLAGRFGRDVLSGGPGADRALGGARRDDISLGAGDDQGFVDAGTYRDGVGRPETLDCGPGYDLFSASRDDEVFGCEEEWPQP
jgi:Ca2+-binding RTX toxin-like protein